MTNLRPPPMPPPPAPPMAPPPQLPTSAVNEQPQGIRLGLVVAAAMLLLFFLIALASVAANRGTNGKAGTGTLADAGTLAGDGGARPMDAAAGGDAGSTDTKAEATAKTTTTGKDAEDAETQEAEAKVTQQHSPLEELPVEETPVVTSEPVPAAASSEEDNVAKNLVTLPKYDGLSDAAAPAQLGSGSSENPFLSAGDSKSTVFVLDVSGSMQSNRKTRVFRALIEGIENLKDNQMFQVLLFDDNVYCFDETADLLKATGSNKLKLAEWLNNSYAGGGGTEPLQAIFSALERRPERIIILSDGEFNPAYVESITRRNSENRPAVRIDAIGLAEVVQVLQELARQNGGIYFQAR